MQTVFIIRRWPSDDIVPYSRLNALSQRHNTVLPIAPLHFTFHLVATSNCIEIFYSTNEKYQLNSILIISLILCYIIKTVHSKSRIQISVYFLNYFEDQKVAHNLVSANGISSQKHLKMRFTRPEFFFPFGNALNQFFRDHIEVLKKCYIRFVQRTVQCITSKI